MFVWQVHASVFDLYKEIDLAKTSFPSRRNMLQHELQDLYGKHNADATTIAMDAEQLRSCMSIAQVRLQWQSAACIRSRSGRELLKPTASLRFRVLSCPVSSSAQLEECHKQLLHVDTRLLGLVEQLRELNAQEALLGVPLSTISGISHSQQFLEPFLRLWESYQVPHMDFLLPKAFPRCDCVLAACLLALTRLSMRLSMQLPRLPLSACSCVRVCCTARMASTAYPVAPVVCRAGSLCSRSGCQRPSCP